jgi:endoglucanase
MNGDIAVYKIMTEIIKQSKLPRWKGFNILHMFSLKFDEPLREDDYKFIHDHGFDFIRVPLNYLYWINNDNTRDINFDVLGKVDEIIDMGLKYNLHINLNFHRGPGFSVNQEKKEPYNLWKDARALDDFCYHWQIFAERYKSITSKQLSFNLINEPAGDASNFSREDHEKVIRATVATIRSVDNSRLIIIDGINYGNSPCPELTDLDIAQSCRGYLPITLTHYKAHWMSEAKDYPLPVWPGATHDGIAWDLNVMKDHYKNWANIARSGVGLHCGELGVLNQTPHDVAISWVRDLLSTLFDHNIGFALWGFRGAFGIIDSNRKDVEYEKYLGYNIDRKMFNLLLKF